MIRASVLEWVFILADIGSFVVAFLAVIGFVKNLKKERFLKNISRMGFIVFGVLFFSEAMNYLSAISKEPSTIRIDRKEVCLSEEGINPEYMITDTQKNVSALNGVIYITKDEYETLKDGDKLTFYDNESADYMKDEYVLRMSADISLGMLFLLLHIICVMNDKKENIDEKDKNAFP